MEVKKAIIAAAGWGTRRLPITKVIEKSMLPVGNRPIIDYIVEDCTRAGIKDIYIVIDPKENSQIKSYFSGNQSLNRFLIARGKMHSLAEVETKPAGVRIHYIHQTDLENRYGTAIPIALAVELNNFTEPVVFCNGDDLFWNAKESSEVKNLLSAACSSEDSVIVGVEKPRAEMPRFGMIEHSDGFMTNLVEKPAPAAVTSTFANVNRFVLSVPLQQEIVNYVKAHKFGPRDQEYMVTDPLLSYVKSGGQIRVVPASGEFLDCGSVEGWLHANNVVLHSAQ
jgi:UTP--glucose-1-phosphate uridylyltransferase